MMRAKAPRPPIAGMLALFLLASTPKVEGEASKRRDLVKARTAQCARLQALRAQACHRERVDILAGAEAVALHLALDRKAEALVKGDRRLVVGIDGQF